MNEVVGDHAKSDPASNAGTEHMRSLIESGAGSVQDYSCANEGLGNTIPPAARPRDLLS